MATTTVGTGREHPAGPANEPLTRRPGRWIDHWHPEDLAFWTGHGRSVARRNLIFSILAEHVGFSVWMLWSIVVVQLTTGPGGRAAASGWALTPTQALWLVAVPSGVGALLRLPYS